MGPAFLTGTQRVVESGGRAAVPLASELDQRVALLYGLAFIEADAVGMARTAGPAARRAGGDRHGRGGDRRARAGSAAWKTDADVVRDPRVIVPVFVDYERETMTYWAVVGVKALVARAEFVAGHEPMVSSTGCWTGNFVPHRYTLLVEETVELELPFAQPAAHAGRAARDLRRARDQGRDRAGARPRR